MGDCDISELIYAYNAQIRFFFKEDPDMLSDNDFAIRVKELKFLAGEGFLNRVMYG